MFFINIDKQDKHRPKHRNKFWFNLWHSLNRPREDAVYEAYEYSKHIV